MNSQVERLLKSAAPGMGSKGWNMTLDICRDLGITRPFEFLKIGSSHPTNCPCGQDENAIPRDDWSGHLLVAVPHADRHRTDAFYNNNRDMLSDFSQDSAHDFDPIEHDLTWDPWNERFNQ